MWKSVKSQWLSHLPFEAVDLYEQANSIRYYCPCLDILHARWKKKKKNLWVAFTDLMLTHFSQFCEKLPQFSVAIYIFFLRITVMPAPILDHQKILNRF